MLHPYLYIALDIYALIITIYTFIAFWLDKRYSVKGSWRLPEKYLLGLCLIGGSVGAYIAMKLFRHKTKHLKFTIGVPLIFLIQCVLTYYVHYYTKMI